MSSCGTACEWRPRGPDPDRVVEESLELISELTKEVRTISHLLHPPLLDEVGL